LRSVYNLLLVGTWSTGIKGRQPRTANHDMVNHDMPNHDMANHDMEVSMTPTTEEIELPSPRGPLSQWVLGRLTGLQTLPPPTVSNDPFADDFQLALYLSYEPHYSALPQVAADREWDPSLINVRRTLEAVFEDGLRDLAGSHPHHDVRHAITDVIERDDSPSLSAHMETHGTLEQMCEFVVHRSAYQLKEGDPHTFAIPRLTGRTKQLLVEIQAGEYGADGDDREMHAALFAQTMRALGLDDRRHAYLDVLPASALALSNLISLFGLNRRWRGSLIGHLTAFEMTSVTPMGRYCRALDRLGAPVAARRFYEVHVLADAEHEVLALDMAAALADDEPTVAPDIVFGARCAIEIEKLFAETLFSGWGIGHRLRHAAA
jgi:hypothetical protein